jgi:hypothetical protein
MREIVIIYCCLGLGAVACGEGVVRSRPQVPVGDRPDSGRADFNALDAGSVSIDARSDPIDAGLSFDSTSSGFEDARAAMPDAGTQTSADSGTSQPGDAGTNTPPDPGPAVLNPDWIGGPCVSNSDCPFAGGRCLPNASGYPGGMCTQTCSRFCPDQSGALNSVTFCIEDDVSTSDGMCVSRCDYTLSQTGCRQGYVCLPQKRMNENSVVRDVCVPRSGIPNRPTPPFDIGESCVNDSACERNTCIQGLPGGYCTQEACHVVGCPSGSSCFRLGQEEYYVCIKNCTNSSQCRQSEGYQCDNQNVCWHVPPQRPPCDLTGGAAACARYSAMASTEFVVVKKSTRSIAHCRGATEVNSYCVGLGGSPVLDKEQEGDQRTPEGFFYIPRLVPNSQYYKAFLISYPDNADAERGFLAGLITASERDAIIAAQAGRREPPQTTSLGGLIEIHGQGSSSDWTWGCMALDNSAIDALWRTLGVNDNVIIEH